MAKVIDNPRQGQGRAAASLYERDFHAWTERQSALLKAGRLADIDVARLVEEVESMGAAERKELHSRLVQLLLHLLKHRYQPRRRGKSWRASVTKQRIGIEILLEESPSLRSRLSDGFGTAYARARRYAAGETGLPPDTFPETCPFTLEQVLDDGYRPA